MRRCSGYPVFGKPACLHYCNLDLGFPLLLLPSICPSSNVLSSVVCLFIWPTKMSVYFLKLSLDLTTFVIFWVDVICLSFLYHFISKAMIFLISVWRGVQVSQPYTVIGKMHALRTWVWCKYFVRSIVYSWFLILLGNG